jgi:hypothetical protein
MSKWKEAIGSATPYKEWARSWRQTIETPFGQYPVLTAHIHKVRCYEDGRIEFFPMPDITISMAELTGNSLVMGVTVEEYLTKLIGDKLEEVD